MIERYTNPRLARLWSDGYRFQKWLEVELAVMESWQELGRIPAKATAETRAKAVIDVSRIQELERETHHDVVAFVESVSEKIGPASAYFHLGLTSSDLLDTANALILREVSDILIQGLEELNALLKELAFKYKEQVQAGRTHGIHAEPVSLGLKFCSFFAENRRAVARLKQARESIGTGKISGAVGTYAHLSPQLEEQVCRRLGLKPETVSTQVIPRDRYAEYLCSLGIAGAGLERLALEIRHLQRTEVGEAAEPFGKKQKGSSAMPHKQNPVLSERICGLSRILRCNVTAGLENIALWHERDISHSSVERVILPDSTIILDYLTTLTIRILKGLRVFPRRMAENLNLTRGLIYSQRILSLLAEKGIGRPEAYRMVQRNALDSFRESRGFQEKLLADPEVTEHLTREEISAAFDPRYFLRHQDAIYQRVFGDHEQKNERDDGR